MEGEFYTNVDIFLAPLEKMFHLQIDATWRASPCFQHRCEEGNKLVRKCHLDGPTCACVKRAILFICVRKMATKLGPLWVPFLQSV